MFEIIFLILTSIYFILLIYISAGLNRRFKKQFSDYPFVSVIVAARNEEENIIACLSSLQNQSYKNYEVIIADDFSDDNTGILIDSFTADKNNFKKIIPGTFPGFTGKMNAVASALKLTSGNIFLFTDADCIVPEKWIENTVAYYNEKTAMVNGFTLTGSENIISGVQSVDLVFLISVAAGMSNNGYPVSCIGNNMSVTRKAMNETGGYAAFNKNAAEDYLLLNKVSSLRKYDIVFPVDPSGVVKTKACRKISDLYNQKKRWAVGGLSFVNISLLLMIISYLTNLMILLSLFFLSSTILMLVSVKIFSDYFFLQQVYKKLNLKLIILHFIFFELYYIIYTIVLPLILLFNRKISWKGRKY